MKRVSNRKLSRAHSTSTLVRRRQPRPLGVSLARFSSVLAMAGALFAGVSSAPAANLRWDAETGTLLVQDGPGIWGVGTPINWTIDNGVTNQGFMNGDDATFGRGVSGTAGLVTLGSPVTVGNLTFNRAFDGFYTIGDGSPVALTLGTGSLAVNDTGNRATIAAILSGTNGLRKFGDGSLVLTNTLNNYSGDTVINGGSVVITEQTQLGTSANTISINGVANTGNPGFSGGQLVVQGSLSAATISREISVLGRGPGATNSSGGLVSIGNNTFSGDLLFAGPATEGRMIATAGTTSLSGLVALGNSQSSVFYGIGNYDITGQVTGFELANDRFIKSGNTYASTLTLSNSSNNFLESIRIDNGTVRVATLGALGLNGSTQAIDLNNGALELRTATNDFTSKKVFSRDNATGTLFVDHAIGASAINQTIAFGDLRSASSSTTTTFNGRNGFSLIFTGAGGTIGTGGGGNATINNNLNGRLTLNASLWNQGDATARTLTIQGNGDTLVTGNIIRTGGGAHNFNKGGLGLVTLDGEASTYTGTLNDFRGTLAIHNFGLASNLIISGTSTTGDEQAALRFLGAVGTGAGVTFSNPVNLAGVRANSTARIDANQAGTAPSALILSGTFTSGAASKNFFIGGTSAPSIQNEIQSVIVNNSGTNLTSLVKDGTNTWVISGANGSAANGFTGSTTITNGTLRLKDTYAGGSRNVLADSAALVFGVDTLTQSAGGTLDYVGAGSNASTETLGALTLSAGGNTVKTTSGGSGATLTFSSLAAPTAGSGVNFTPDANGAIKITGTAGFVDARAIFNSTDFAYSDAATTLRAPMYDVDGGFVTAVGGTLTPLSHNLVMANTSTGAVSINSLKISGSQTVAQTGLLTISGGTFSAGGILVTGGNAAVISGTGVTTASAGDLVVRVDGSGDVLTISAPVTSTTAGGITKNGLGTLILSGANAEVGTVTVNRGTLQMGAGGLLGATNIGLTVRQGATFDLNGVNVGTATSGTNSVNAFNGAGTITNSAASGTASLRVGNNNVGGLFTGQIQDGATAKLAFIKAGSGRATIQPSSAPDSTSRSRGYWRGSASTVRMSLARLTWTTSGIVPSSTGNSAFASARVSSELPSRPSNAAGLRRYSSACAKRVAQHGVAAGRLPPATGAPFSPSSTYWNARARVTGSGSSPRSITAPWPAKIEPAGFGRDEDARHATGALVGDRAPRSG